MGVGGGGEEGGMIRVSLCNKKKHRQLIAWFAISFGLGIVLHKVFFFIICSFNNNELRNAPMAKLFISCTGQSPVFLDNNLRTQAGSFGTFSRCSDKVSR